MNGCLLWGPKMVRSVSGLQGMQQLIRINFSERDPASSIPLAHLYEKKDLIEPGAKQFKKEPAKGVKVTGLAWNPTGDQLASAGLDSCVKVDIVDKT